MKLKQNSIRCYLRTLNTLLCKAVEEGLLNNTNLFCHVRLSYVKTTKRAISEKELKVIANLELPENSTMALARDIFMFSFYMRGMPFVDIAYLRKSDLRNGMWTYCRRKTNQCLMVEWEKAQQKILDRYAHQMVGCSYLFPIITKEDGTEYQQYQRMQININRSLKKIGEMAELKMPLTTYVARLFLCSLVQLHFGRILIQPVHIKQAYNIIILLVQVRFHQFQYMIDVAVLRKIRSDLKGIATRNPQGIEIKPFRFSLAYDGDTFCYCPPHIISRLG